MRRVYHTDDGFTLVELMMTIVIMGIVIAPLCMALVQTLNTIPTSGAGIQTSTDAGRLQTAMVDDIGQAQGIDVYMGSNGVYYIPLNDLPLPAFVENSPTSWSTTDNTSSLNQFPFKCQAWSQPWNLFDVFQSSSLNANGTVPGRTGATTTVDLYTATVTNVSGNWNKVVVHRWVSNAGAPAFPAVGPAPYAAGTSPGSFTDTDPNGYLTGYCNSASPSGGETIARLSTTSYNDGGQTKESLAVTFTLHAQAGTTPTYMTTVQANPRPSGSTDS